MIVSLSLNHLLPPPKNIAVETALISRFMVVKKMFWITIHIRAKHTTTHNLMKTRDHMPSKDFPSLIHHDPSSETYYHFLLCVFPNLLLPTLHYLEFFDSNPL